MNAHEHTDPHGDGLTITHDDGKMWITCTTAHAEVTVGPLAAGILADHDMDGGVAAALIEQEAEQPTAEVRELRSALAREVARGNALQDALDAAEPRPLTPDAITDESVERAQSELLDTAGLYVSRSSMRDVLIAALTEPPARPEGAEEIDQHLRQANAAALGGALTPEQRRALADHLAGFGYRSPIALPTARRP